MAWLGKSHGIFRLHDSDNYCGSFMSLEDAAEILNVTISAFQKLPIVREEGIDYISELDLHRAWGGGRILSPHIPKIGNATRSLDEIILIKIIQLTLPSSEIEPQVPFGRKRADLMVTHNRKSVIIEFVGPSHFIPQYQREIKSPIDRKKEIEDVFGVECVIWPYWIQRCSMNVKTIFNPGNEGLASVWSTKAYFGDFVYQDSTAIILEISNRFKAIRENGIGYMYGNKHTNKPIHPIIIKTKSKEELEVKLIPKGNKYPKEFWLPDVNNFID